MIKEIRLTAKNGQVFATSRQIAKDFEKEHGSVLKTIEGENRKQEHIQGLIDEILASGFPLANYFTKSTYLSRGKEYPEYELTKDGFSLLAMGFTGVKASQWKLKYIAKFNLMEQQLREIETTMNSKTTLSEEDYAEVKFSTAQRVGNTFTDSQDIQKDYDRFTAYSRKTMDVPKRITRLNQILDSLQTKEDDLYIKKSKGYKSERENIIELREQILKDINTINNRSYGQKLGHAISKKHNIGIEYWNIQSLNQNKYPTKRDIKKYMLDLQLGRRNLTVVQKFAIAEKYKPLLEKQAKANQGVRNDIKTTLSKSTPINVRKELAKKIETSEGTYAKLDKIFKSDNEEIKQKLNNKEISVNAAYKLIVPPTPNYMCQVCMRKLNHRQF